MSDDASQLPPDVYDDVILDAIATPAEDAALKYLNAALARGERVSSMDRPSLYYATLYGNLRVIARLIEAGATLAAEWRPSTTPSGSVDNICDNASAFHEAANAGRLDIIRLFLDIDGRDFLNQFNDLYYSPLIAAVVGGHVNVARELLLAGSDPNAWDEPCVGFTALDQAVLSNRLDLIQLLIDAGADPSIPTWMHMTALQRCKSSEARAILKTAHPGVSNLRSK